MRASLFYYYFIVHSKNSKIALNKTKIELKNENQTCTFAGFGINMLFSLSLIFLFEKANN